MKERVENKNLFYSKIPQEDIEILKDQLQKVDAKLSTVTGHEQTLLAIQKKTLEEGIKNIIEYQKNTVKRFVEPSIKRLS